MIFGHDPGTRSTSTVWFSNANADATTTIDLWSNRITSNQITEAFDRLDEAIAELKTALDRWRARCVVWTRLALDEARTRSRTRRPEGGPQRAHGQPLRRSRACADRWRSCLL